MKRCPRCDYVEPVKRPRRYSIGPLFAVMGLPPRHHGPLGSRPLVTNAQIGLMLGVTADAVTKYRKRGVGTRIADQLATAAGFHPGDVWADWWDA